MTAKKASPPIHGDELTMCVSDTTRQKYEVCDDLVVTVLVRTGNAHGNRDSGLLSTPNAGWKDA